MNAFIVTVIILFITCLGFVIIRGFNLLPKKELLASIACGYGLGVGAVSTQLFIYARFDISWHPFWLLTPWIIFVISMVIFRREAFIFKVDKVPEFTIFEKCLIVGICLTIAYVILEALIRPVTVWDGWAIWLLKSKLFFIDGTIQAHILDYIKSDYPLTISLFGSYIYILLGSIDDTSILLTSVAFLISLSILFFSTLKRYYGLSYALLFTFLLFTTQNFIRHGGRMEAGQADLPLSYFIFTCAILLLEYIRKSNPQIILLLSIFLGITVLIKFEGVVFSLIIVSILAYHIYQKKRYKHILFLLMWFIPLLDWQVYKNMFGINVNYFAAHPLEISLQKIASSIFGTLSELLNAKTWSLLWIIYFYGLFFIKSKEQKTIFLLNVIILLQLSIYLMMYFFFAGNSPESSIERLLMHLAPLAVLVIALKAR